MHINLNLKSNAVMEAAQRPPHAPAVGPVRDRAAFENLQGLGQKLDSLPVVRPDAVARGQELLSAADYPPERTMRSIATLLAVRMEQRERSSD